MKKNLILPLLAFALLFTACSPNKKVLKIGINTELTGEIPAVGASCLNAAKLFVEHANKDGGIDVGGVKMPISLIVGDNGAKPDQAAAVAQRLISQEGVLVMVGPNTSSCAIPAAEIAESLHCLMFSPWSTNPLTTLDRKTKTPKKYVYRGCFTDAVEIPALAQFARNNLHLKRAAILYDISSEYPTTATPLFTKSFTEHGGSVVATETYTTGDRDFSAQLTKIKEAKPDVLFLPAYYNDAPLIAQQARRLGITAVLLGGNSWSTPEMLKLDSAHYLNGAFLSNHFSTQADAPQIQNGVLAELAADDAKQGVAGAQQRSVYRNTRAASTGATQLGASAVELCKKSSFIAEYQNKFGQLPDDIAALTYDTMGILSEAITKAGKADRTAILDAMGKVNQFSGITGNFIYEAGSHSPKKSIVILTVKDGAFGYVTTVEP